MEQALSVSYDLGKKLSERAIRGAMEKGITEFAKLPLEGDIN